MARIARDVPGPDAKASMKLYGANPFSEKLAFGFVLLGILAFDFEDERFAGGHADQIVRTIFQDDAAVDVDDFKAHVVVLDPGGDI